MTVDVLNGTGTTGLAGSVADALRGQGFTVGAVGNSTVKVPQSVVRFGPEAQERARTLAAAVPGSVLQGDPSAGGAVQLIIGPGYSTVVPVPVPVPVPVQVAPPPAAGSAGGSAGPVQGPSVGSTSPATARCA